MFEVKIIKIFLKFILKIKDTKKEKVKNAQSNLSNVCFKLFRCVGV